MTDQYVVSVDPFSCTRSIIRSLGVWLHELAKPLIPAVRDPTPDGHFRWRFRREDPHALLVGKLVRATTSIRGALALVDEHRLTGEAAGLLRNVSDYSSEVIAVTRGIVAGKLTTDEQRFVDSYFKPFPGSTEELMRADRRTYVSRRDLYKSHRRLAQDAGQDAEKMTALLESLNLGYDAYVHGAYVTAMELYTGNGHRFMLDGHESDDYIVTMMRAVAGKLHEVVVAFELSATAFQAWQLVARIRSSRHALERSGEQSQARGW
jgi:hypothetical protein